ncbi:unnamed protein product [Rotaria socialis]
MIREPSHHTCIQSSSKKVVLEEAISRMKKRAGEETLPISQIYSQEIIKVPVNNPDMNTGTFFPMLDSIDSSLYRKRAKNYPKIPTTINELIIPDGWKPGSHGEPFLLVDEILEKTWAEVMDEHTPNHSSSIKFNGYIVSTYFDRTSCRYPVTSWNVNDALNSNIPRTNNHVEGYNSRLGSLFPVHPHIYKFIELLRDEHLFQHHHAE